MPLHKKDPRRDDTTSGESGRGSAQRVDVPIKIAPDYSEIRCRNEDAGRMDAGSGLNQQS